MLLAGAKNVCLLVLLELNCELWVTYVVMLLCLILGSVAFFSHIISSEGERGWSKEQWSGQMFS